MKRFLGKCRMKLGALGEKLAKEIDEKKRKEMEEKLERIKNDAKETPTFMPNTRQPVGRSCAFGNRCFGKPMKGK